MLNRTLITLIVIDNTTREPETIMPIVALRQNQIDLLNGFVANFCSQRNISLVIPADFRSWSNNVGINEFRCEVCNQSCLQPTINFDTLNTTERFYSNFCRRTVDRESQE